MHKTNTFSPLLVLLCVSLGCNQFRSDTGSTGNASNKANTQANTAPKREKLVDIPSLIGKSLDDIKKQLGEPAETISDMHKWKFGRGELTVYCDYRDRKKVERLGLEMQSVTVDGHTVRGFGTYEELGDVVGIDVRGKTPTTQKPDGPVEFEKIDIGGKTVDEIEFEKTLETFDRVTVTPNRGY